LSGIRIELTTSGGELALETDERTWSTARLAEASAVLIELADVGLLPEDYEEEVRSFGHDLARIAELIDDGR